MNPSNSTHRFEVEELFGDYLSLLDGRRVTLGPETVAEPHAHLLLKPGGQS